MMRLKFIITLCLLTLCSGMLYAQDSTRSSTDLMRSNGRIYVVVAVMVTILIGLILYVARVERKISKLEKENS